jgi:hypothetical protein
MDQATVISLIAIGISAVSTILVPFIQLLINHKNAKKQVIYEAKREALIEALNFIDDFFSYLTWRDNVALQEIETAKDPNCTVENMTVRSRKMLNLLCAYCDEQKTIDLYLALVLRPTDKPTELFINFREACREELGLSTVEFNKNEVFIAKVSSEELEKKGHNCPERKL